LQQALILTPWPWQVP